MYVRTGEVKIISQRQSFVSSHSKDVTSVHELRPRRPFHLPVSQVSEEAGLWRRLNITETGPQQQLLGADL